MRSTKNNVIHIEKVRQNGELPPFLGVIQRHFEKAKPVIQPQQKGEISLVAPVDMLDFLLPAAILNSIESLTITYKR